MRFTMLQIALALTLVTPVFAADPPKSDAKNDGESVAMLCAVNEHEIVVGAVAEQKKVTGGVLDYAKTMQREHGQNLIDTLVKSKIAPSDTPAVEALKKKHAAGLADLANKEGDAFGKAYVDAMVSGHTEVLALLDQRIAMTGDAGLKKHLTDTRGHVAMHLDAAKKLQSASTTTSTTNAPTKTK